MKVIAKFKAPLMLAAIYLALAAWSFDIAQRSVLVAQDYIMEMVLIIPPVFILMGLLQVWVPKERITALIGKGTGLKGVLISFILGTIPTGPVYIAFPMAGSLMQKGARLSNIVIFLGAWAAIKIPQLIAEAQFLGPEFTALRFILTLISVIIIGYVIEKLVGAKDLPQPNKEEESK
ncbi:MAG: permease [Bacillota bacterium]